MPDAVALGPLLVRILATAVVSGAVVAMLLATPVARLVGTPSRSLARILEFSLLAALAGARGGHVLANLPAYAERPWAVLYLWQPGYAPGYGAALGVATALLLLRRQPPAERTPAFAGLVATVVGGATVALAVLAVLVSLAPAVVGPGARLPDFAMQDLDGRPVRLADFAGRPVILNFWATWCPPCVREMPLLDEVARRYAERGLLVVGVDVGESAAVVREFAARAAVGYPLWVDPESGPVAQPLFDRLGGVGLPTTWFIGADGRVAGHVTGELPRALAYEWAERLTAR